MELNFNSAVSEQFGCAVLLNLITSLSVACLPARLLTRGFCSAPQKSSEIFFVGYELDFSIAFFHAQTRDSLSFYSVQLSAPDSCAIPSKLTFQLRCTRLRLSSPHVLNCDYKLMLVLDGHARGKTTEKDVSFCSLTISVHEN